MTDVRITQLVVNVIREATVRYDNAYDAKYVNKESA